MLTCLDRPPGANSGGDEGEMRSMQDKVRDLEIRLMRSELGSADGSPSMQSNQSPNAEVKQLHDKLERLETSIVKSVDAVNARSTMAMNTASVLAQRGSSRVSDEGSEERLLGKIRTLLESDAFLGGLRNTVKDELRRHETSTTDKMYTIEKEISAARQDAAAASRELSLRLQQCEKEMQNMSQLMAAKPGDAGTAQWSGQADPALHSKADAIHAKIETKTADLCTKLEGKTELLYGRLDAKTDALHMKLDGLASRIHEGQLASLTAGQLAQPPSSGRRDRMYARLDEKTDAIHEKLDGLASRILEKPLSNGSGSKAPELHGYSDSMVAVSNSMMPVLPPPGAGVGQEMSEDMTKMHAGLHAQNDTLMQKHDMLHGRIDGLGQQLQGVQDRLDNMQEGRYDSLGPLPAQISPGLMAVPAVPGDPEALYDSTVGLDRDKNYLVRRKLLHRVKMESKIEMNLGRLIIFAGMLCSFIFCLGTYDPNVQISKIHANLHLSFDTETALAATDSSDILNYLQGFLETAYTMAPALVDANTMNSIDFARCTDSDVGDVCRLTYWMSIGMTPADKENINRIIMDQVTESNARSILDCDAGSAPYNCVDRREQLQAQSNADKTLGLLPEDPIILQSRLDYPIAFVVPLTPVVWQTRAKRKECSGFGDKYNYEVLGAGLCGVEDDCDPESVTSFAGTKPARRTDRDQSFFISYSEAVFSCVDRAEYETTFSDRSWHPWATRADLTQGVEMQAEDLAGLPVFYKFVSDVAYLQRPINGSVLADNSGDCYNPCDAASDLCTDPILYEDHALWREDGDNKIYFPSNETCTLRKGWSDRYLAKSIGDRMNTFLTLETTSFTVSVMVVTPQPEEYADVQTLVRVKWEIDQGGTVTGSASIQSTSQTTDEWYYTVGITVCLSLLHMSIAVYDFYDSLVNVEESRLTLRWKREQATVDLLIGLGTCAVVITNMVLEILPPDVSAELLGSFKANSQETYFKVFRSIVMYNENIVQLKQFGFLAVCLLFWRLVLFFSMHPRLAILVRCLKQMGGALFHFMVYFLTIFSVLAFLGHWMFSAVNNLQFGSVTTAIYTQFKMFVGEIPWPAGVPDLYFYIYLLLYVIIVVVFLMNFLTAIMLQAYFAVRQENSEDIETERNVASDFYDVGRTLIKRRRYKFPSATRVHKYLVALANDPASVHLPRYISSQELFTALKNPQNDKPIFHSEEHAQQFIDFYATKVKDAHGQSVLKFKHDF
eukprot:TRINITY_DN3891_c0_g7_i1.p1 TRINITY_DN3891_c0_g7~~TRINITY_DN3891_c0_g7_i1.p1  ORF type:complete len:1236 (+),score=228.38 TRINITY_DN3891_c0_g7_i1:69-3776(+)